MRKVALIFVLAVLVPSLVLAWLAMHSLHDQQFLIERQQSQIYQNVTDSIAKDISDKIASEQQKFAALAESIAATNADAAAVQFNDEIRKCWPLADVGFCVRLSGPATCTISCPSPAQGAEAHQFLVDNGNFLGNQETAEVYWNANANNFGQTFQATFLTPDEEKKLSGKQALSLDRNVNDFNSSSLQNSSNLKAQSRVVNPQTQAQSPSPDNNLSKITPAEAEFRQLIGDNTDGMVARFLQNELKLMFWHRLLSNPNLIFGTQVNLNQLRQEFFPLYQPDDQLRREILVEVLNDKANPVADLSSPANTHVELDMKHPFVATEIGEALPHWEVAAYLVNPMQVQQAARTVTLTLGLLILLLIVAIGVGSWVIVHCLNKELRLARQKTDFVSNVSHELKTPLTSIRMFSELLADARATEKDKQRTYLNIIAAEAARLTRLIDNVLDFSRMERGEKKYNFQPCDATEVARNAAETFRPHLESSGFKFDSSLPDKPIPVQGDRDALSQIIVNLLSNAEKYSNGRKEISLQVERKETPVPHAEIKVLDRGSGVPQGSEEKIFEKFYRAHDSLSSGIQGSGLGLTIARQIARAHGGNIVYEPREGGGSCFNLWLPIKPS